MSLCSDGLSSDQYFLVNFIMSNYLGPDVYSDNPRCSASRRLAKVLPPYTLKHIGSSSLTVAQLQNLYYYVLRNADPSLVLHPDMVYMYLKGCLPLEPPGRYPQFTYFFPTNLHPQKRYSPSLEIVKGIVVVDDPEVAFIRKEVLQLFRCLSRLNDLKIDRVVCLSPRPVQLNDSPGTEQQNCSRNGEVISNGLVTNQDLNLSGALQEKCKRKNEEETVAGPAVCVISKITEGISGDMPQIQGTEHDSSRNGEVTSNGLVNNQDLDSSGVLQEKCKRKSEEEAVVGLAVCKNQEGVSGDTPQSRGREHDCSRNGEVMSNGLVNNQDLDSSGVLPEKCKRKSEEEAVVGLAFCKNQEGLSGDIPQSRGAEQSCSRNGEVTSNGLGTNQDLDSSGVLQETCKRKREEEAVVGPVVYEISKTQEGMSGDIPQSQGTEHDCSRDEEEVTTNGLVSVEEFNSSAEIQERCKRKKEEEEAVADHAVCGASKTPERFRETYKRKRFKNSSTKAKHKNGETDMERDETDQGISLKLVPFPPDMKEKCEPEPAVVTTGTASKATAGSSIGVVDIGVNKVAYFFQVALPGVRRDCGEFSCEIESDGKVILEGSTTTGEKTIKRHSRVFEMNIRKLCPPGPFKLCFNLPGPVDPRLFSPNFRSDGIFEAVIIRTQES